MKQRYRSMVAVVILLVSCGESPRQLPKESLAVTSSSVPFKPVPFPNTQISGFNFPEAEATLDQWIAKNNMANISLHGWGIWTGLTMNSGEQYNNQPLRVFETWFDISEVAAATQAKQNNALQDIMQLQRSQGKLKGLRQFEHAARQRVKALNQPIPSEDSARIVGFVKYDPTAAGFAIDNKLLLNSVLSGMLSQGMTDIPDFPNKSLALKPVFKIITKSSLVNGLFQMKAWTGPPPTPIAYGEEKWPGCVYIDPNNQGKGNGSVDTGCKGATPSTTYNLSDFVYFAIDQQTAVDLKTVKGMEAVQAGDIAVLVAMHVTSREIKRWTWQTFWWAPNPDAPPAPSSKQTASYRPAQLQGAPRHYAMAIGYTFINPDQPFTGGNNKGTSIYAFNPYLEAGFDPSVFYQVAQVITNGKTVVNDVGVRTNCMSCHALANFAPSSVATAPGYMADTYIDMNGTRFKGTLKVDFLWSIPVNVIQ